MWITQRVHVFLNHLNGVEPSIQFTVQMELEGKLSVLDDLYQHDPDGSTITVFRKASHTTVFFILHSATHWPTSGGQDTTQQGRSDLLDCDHQGS